MSTADEGTEGEDPTHVLMNRIVDSFIECYRMVFGFHALRRHVASYLADSGNVSIKAIQGLLRHQSLQVTERYVQRISSDLRDTVVLLRTE